MALKALSGVTQGASSFARLPNGFKRSSKLTQTLPIDGVNKATIRVVIGATASGNGVFNGSATASVTITASANGQQTDQQHTGVATVNVAITASASGTATGSSTAHSGTASCQVNLSASAAGFNTSTQIPDETTNSNVMELLNSPTLTTDSAVGSRAVAFDPSGSAEGGRIDTNYESTFQSPFSLSVWTKPDDGILAGDNQYIFSAYSGNVGGVENWRWDLRQIGGKIRAGVVNYPGSGSQNESIKETTANAYSDGAQSSYTHIAVTFNSSAVPTIYVNGTAVTLTTVASASLSLSNYDSTNDCVSVGGIFTSSSDTSPIYSYDGKLDDISLWSTELTSTEVSNLYNSGSGTDLTGRSDLEGWWKMGDSNVQPVTHSGTATASVAITASASGSAYTVHSGTASCQVNLSASASGTYIQGDEGVVEGLSGKLCWFDADDITGSSNGDNLSSWPSRHDSGVSASNSTSSTQPIYNTNQINSLPAVNFDADYLEVDYGSNTSQPVTAFVVCAYDVTTGGGSNNAIDGRDNPSGYRAVNFSMRTNGWGSYSGSSWMEPSSGSPDTNWHYFTVYLNGASSYIRKDGVSHTTGNPGTQGTNGQILGMWKGKNTSYYMNGKIAEVLIFGGTLSDTNRNTTESYLKDKYNL